MTMTMLRDTREYRIIGLVIPCDGKFKGAFCPPATAAEHMRQWEMINKSRDLHLTVDVLPCRKGRGCCRQVCREMNGQDRFVCQKRWILAFHLGLECLSPRSGNNDREFFSSNTSTTQKHPQWGGFTRGKCLMCVQSTPIVNVYKCSCVYLLNFFLIKKTSCTLCTKYRIQGTIVRVTR